MRTTYLAAALLFAMTGTSFAQTGPVFRPVSEDPSLKLPAGAVVKAPAAAVATPHTLTPPPGAVATTTSPAPLPVARNGETIDSEGSGAIPALPLEMTTENNIVYISGGISDEEVAQLTAHEEQFNLRVQIVGLGGEFVSDVSLALKDDKGATLLTVGNAGPFVYLQVPAGSYKVVVTGEGKSKEVSLKVPAKGAMKTLIKV